MILAMVFAIGRRTHYLYCLRAALCLFIKKCTVKLPVMQSSHYGLSLQ